jgi:hypothetical protein
MVLTAIGASSEHSARHRERAAPPHLRCGRRQPRSGIESWNAHHVAADIIRIMLLCVLLAGCSSVVESFPENLLAAPSLSAVAATLKTVAAQAHLAEPVEVSDPIRANPISSWLICPRSGQSKSSAA